MSREYLLTPYFAARTADVLFCPLLLTSILLDQGYLLYWQLIARLCKFVEICCNTGKTPGYGFEGILPADF